MTVVQFLSRYQCIVADVANTTQASQYTNAAVIFYLLIYREKG